MCSIEVLKTNQGKNGCDKKGLGKPLRHVQRDCSKIDKQEEQGPKPVHRLHASARSAIFSYLSLDWVQVWLILCPVSK